MSTETLLSQQLILLLAQVLELKTELAILRGRPLVDAIEEAFAFMEVSPLLSELFDDEHLSIYKKAQIRHFTERQELPRHH